jgi:hypothetical protein
MYLEFGIDDDHYVPVWLREKLWKHLGTNHSEQYRKAWFASFPPEALASGRGRNLRWKHLSGAKRWNKDSRVAM